MIAVPSRRPSGSRKEMPRINPYARIPSDIFSKRRMLKKLKAKKAHLTAIHNERIIALNKIISKLTYDIENKEDSK